MILSRADAQQVIRLKKVQGKKKRSQAAAAAQKELEKKGKVFPQAQVVEGSLNEEGVRDLLSTKDEDVIF
jgi:hypothetical protein